MTAGNEFRPLHLQDHWPFFCLDRRKKNSTEKVYDPVYSFLPVFFFSCRCGGLLQARPERLLIERERAVHGPPLSVREKKDMAAPFTRARTHKAEEKRITMTSASIFKAFSGGVCVIRSVATRRHVRPIASEIT